MEFADENAPWTEVVLILSGFFVLFWGFVFFKEKKLCCLTNIKYIGLT